MVDTHCHLDSCDPPLDELLDRAAGAGVSRVATVGMDDASVESALAAADREAVVAIVGRHPHKTEGFGESDLARIEAAAGDPRSRAIGETGLDFYRDNAPREDQRRAFEAHIDLAARLRMPLVIHTRAAEEETFALLREKAGDLTVILHCFSAPDHVEECVARGWLCSFAGNVTYPSAEALRAAAREIPDELLLVETDSPYLAPQPMRGRPNEPANVVATAEAVAALRRVSYAELEATVERNAARVFGW